MIEKIDIIKVVERYVNLKKKGRQYVGLCPFHKEKTPSFHVDPDRGIYHCFGCGASGNAITFLSEIEGISRKEAIMELAEEFNLEPEGFKISRDYPVIYDILNEASRFYKMQLFKNRVVQEYLKGRGLTPESIAEWEIGFSPDKYSVIRYLIKKGFSSYDIVMSGTGVNTSRELYDRFHSRVIFPIKDITGRVVSFAGRTLEKDGQPKYLNGPDTKIFKKSTLLYGIHKAKKFARSEGYFYLVEGYMDVILLHQYGYNNTIGVMGTSFTKTQANILYRFAQKVVVIPDGDEAGAKSAESHIFTLLEEGIDPYVIVLPGGYDPADYILQHSSLPDHISGFKFILKDKPDDPREFADRLSKGKRFVSILKEADENLAAYYLNELKSWAGMDVVIHNSTGNRQPYRRKVSMGNMDRVLILGYAYGFTDKVMEILKNINTKTALQHKIENFIKSGYTFAEFFESLKPEEADVIQGFEMSEEEVLRILERITDELRAESKKEEVKEDVKALLEFYKMKKEVCV